jgi:Protein of unknown function (DUF3455)
MRGLIDIVIGGMVVLAGCAQAESSDLPTEDVAGQASALIDGSHGPRCPAVTPATLNPPADVTLSEGFSARGVQIYVCSVPAAGGAPVWTLKAPHAVLFQGGEVGAIHFAGPSWQAVDGSLVTGAKVAAATPDPTAIPWLLLQAATNTGPGVFSDVTWLQRLDTVGGLAPATGCDADHVNAQVLVPYRANYFFYDAAVAGKRVRQCAGL